MINIELVRPQAELLIDLLLVELDSLKNVNSHETASTLEEIAVKSGMCKVEGFESWLAKQRGLTQ